MATVTVNPGICGLKTTIKAVSEDLQNAVVTIESECPHIRAMSMDIDEIDSFTECFAHVGDGDVYRAARKHCKHAACPVAPAVLKAVEVACGLALPKDVEFKISR